MKFDMLMNTIWEIILLKNHAEIAVEKRGPGPAKIKHISKSTVWSFMQFIFTACPSQRLPKHIESKTLPTWFYFI